MRIPAATALLALLAGCANEPLTLQENTTYFAEWVGDEPVIGRRKLSLTFSEGRAYGNTGCNHWFADYRRDGAALRFSDIGLTRMACAEPLATQERHFIEMIEKTERWDVSNIDQLRLWPASGAALRFWPSQD